MVNDHWAVKYHHSICAAQESKAGYWCFLLFVVADLYGERALMVDRIAKLMQVLQLPWILSEFHINCSIKTRYCILCSLPLVAQLSNPNANY